MPSVVLTPSPFKACLEGATCFYTTVEPGVAMLAHRQSTVDRFRNHCEPNYQYVRSRRQGNLLHPCRKGIRIKDESFLERVRSTRAMWCVGMLNLLLSMLELLESTKKADTAANESILWMEEKVNASDVTSGRGWSRSSRVVFRRCDPQDCEKMLLRDRLWSPCPISTSATLLEGSKFVALMHHLNAHMFYTKRTAGQIISRSVWRCCGLLKLNAANSEGESSLSSLTIAW